MRVYYLFIVFTFTFLQSIAQKGKDSNAKISVKNKFEEFQKNINASQLNKDSILSQMQQLSNEKFRTELALEKDRQRELEDNNYDMRHRWRSFDFQFTASILIFIMVIIIVACGLVFSAWQFRIAVKQMNVKEAVVKAVALPKDAATGDDPKNQQAPIAAPAYDMLKSQLEVSSAGIKVNSSLLGVIILVLSIVFFYFYLIYVYPIKYLPKQPGPAKDSIGVKSN